MSVHTRMFIARPLVVAIQAGLAALALGPLAVHAADDADVTALTKPTNWIQVGIGDNSKAAPKFGEYSGLTNDGTDFIGSFLLRGGDAWGQGNGTMKWLVRGTDLGTTSRSFEASLASQGKWRLGLEDDNLSHYITNGYQTPLVGAMGGNRFILPEGFGVVDSASKATPYGAQNLTDVQKAFFHTEKVHSDRNTLTLSGGFDFTDQLNLKVSLGHVRQSGAKLMAASTDGNVPATGNTLVGYTPGKEAIQILMNPTAYTTDNVNASFNWVGDKAWASFTYYGSHFTDTYRTVDFSNPYTSAAGVANGSLLGVPFPVNQLSTMPDSDFNQFGLTGGFRFTPTTQLVGSYSTAHNTQNTPFVNQDQMQEGGLPRSSLNGDVLTTHADLKLTDRSIHGLTLLAGFKYNERENRTAAATYGFLDLGAENETSVSIPMSNRRTQFELAADFRVTPGQTLHLGYEREKIERWCKDPLSNAAQGAVSETNTGYYTTASCVQVPNSSENKLSAGYRARLGEDLHLNLGLGYGDRKSTVNASFYNPMQANEEGFENFGYVAFFDASRQERSAKAGLDWQVLESLDVTLSGRVVQDKYNDSALGVQRSNGASANLDATFSLSEAMSVSGFASWQHRTRDLLTANGRNAVAALTTTWTNDLADNANTVGVSAKHSGLFGGRLDVSAEALYSLAKTAQSTALNYVAASCTAPSNAGYSCGATPDVRNSLRQVRLTGEYRLDKRSAVVLGYQYQRVASDDYFYNFYQMGFTGATTMPTNQPGAAYTQNRVFAAYRYTFQ